MMYRVSWEIDIEAETPDEAARKALAIQRDRDSTALHFMATDRRGKVAAIDLWGAPGTADSWGTPPRPANQAGRLVALADVMTKIDAIAENAIRDELDMPPLRAGELCPLRAIVDMVSRVQYAISDTLNARLQKSGAAAEEE